MKLIDADGLLEQCERLIEFWIAHCDTNKYEMEFIRGNITGIRMVVNFIKDHDRVVIKTPDNIDFKETLEQARNELRQFDEPVIDQFINILTELKAKK